MAWSYVTRGGGEEEGEGARRRRRREEEPCGIQQRVLKVLGRGGC